MMPPTVVRSDGNYVYSHTNNNGGRSSRTSVRSGRRNQHNNNAPIARLISKTGRLNTCLTNLPNNKHIVFFRDLGNTLLTIRWRWILTTICLVNFISFFLFGLLWMAVAYASGDFNELQSEMLAHNAKCVHNVHSYAGYVLLSIETIMTIGYGYRYPTEKCTQGWLLQILQAFVSVAIQGVLISVVYVKTAKPFTKNTKSIFSRKAVVCLRDGELCLIVRVIDLVGKILIRTDISMYFVDKSNNNEATGGSDVNADGNTTDLDAFFIRQIKIQPYGFLVFPLEIVHVINEKSPLWKLSPVDIISKRFELVIMAEGSSIITSQLSQIRTSYVNSDILWGHRFAPCHALDTNQMKYIVNYKNLNATVSFDTPLCSAEELHTIRDNLLKDGDDDKPINNNDSLITKRHQTL